jgi:DNA-binding transcriptional LysR family regulator
MVSAVMSVEIADILRRFRETHPTVQIVLHDLPPAEQLRLIGEGRLDGGFVGLLPVERTTNLRFDKWCRERLLAFVPSGQTLAGRKEVSLADLRAERFVAVSSEAAPAFSVLLHELCRKAGFRPSIVLESPRAQAVAVMVAAGCGVAVLPESLANFAGRSVVGIPLKGAPAITHIFASAGKTPSPAIKGLLRLLGKSSR